MQGDGKVPLPLRVDGKIPDQSIAAPTEIFIIAAIAGTECHRERQFITIEILRILSKRFKTVTAGREGMTHILC